MVTHQLLIGVLLGVSSAAAANVGVVVEKRAMRRMPPLNARKSSDMIARLVSNPMWLLGFCIVAFGLVVQVVALSVASISVVQAVAPTGTALLLVLSHIFLGDRLRRAEYFGIAALVVALGLLALSLDAHSDKATGSASVAALLAVTIPAVGASLLFFGIASRVRRRKLKAPLYGVATGFLYACAALDMKSMSTFMQRSGVVRAVPHIVVSPVFYMFLATSFLVFLLFQMALQRSTTSVFVPVSSVLSTACFIVVGDALFHEHLPRAPLSLSLRLASFAMLAVGLLTLAIANEAHDPEEQEDHEEERKAADSPVLLGEGDPEASGHEGEAADSPTPLSASEASEDEQEAAVLPAPLAETVRFGTDDLLATLERERDLKLTLSEFDLVCVAEEAVDAVQSLASLAGVKAIMQPCTQGVPIVGDRDRIGQLLGNLLSNAVRFSPRYARVQLEIDTSGDFARVRVMDEGRGIPSAEREHLFEDAPRHEPKSETGTTVTVSGLATLRSVAEAHEGFVDIVDTPGWSTTFRVLIPLRPEDRPGRGSVTSDAYSAGHSLD